VAAKLHWKVPVAVHHHMLMGLQGGKKPEGYDENSKIDAEISSKMSKSRPETSIFVHDTAEVIAKKMSEAYCPPKLVAGNPVLEYAKYIVFRKTDSLRIERPAKYGGPLEFADYEELEQSYRNGNLHPADLKKGVSAALDGIVGPIRSHFEKDRSARELYEQVRAEEITR
jgi:tyrosyl-tRNA synthetase